MNQKITTTRTSFKVFLPWQDENEEKWLEELAMDGWMLESVVPFAYRFRMRTEKPTVIRLDYKNSWDKDYQMYLATFCDAGWTLQTTLGNWHYFSINPQHEVVPEIYNSNHAKAHKYRRVLLGLSPLLLLVVGQLPRALFFSGQTTESGFDLSLRVFYLLTSFLFLYSFLRVCIKLIQLKTNNKE